MAEEKKEEEQEQGSGKKKMIILIVAGILLLAIGGGGAVFFMGSKEPAEDEMAGEMEEMPAEPEMAIYHDLHPAFVANFTGKSKKKYMQVYMVALANKESVIEDLKMHMPAVRNDIFNDVK